MRSSPRVWFAYAMSAIRSWICPCSRDRDCQAGKMAVRFKEQQLAKASRACRPPRRDSRDARTTASGGSDADHAVCRL